MVEDHKETCALIKALIEREGYLFACAKTLREGKEYLFRQRPALIILDLRLPDGNGLELCELVRGSPELAKIPIIALTGLTELSDKKRGFDAGVDQYLEKPLILEELPLWIHALLRRVEWDANKEPLPAYGDLQISGESYIIRFQDKVIGNLTRREFDLFYFLVKNSPKVYSREAIISGVWKTASVENLVDTHIFNLRQKLPRQLAQRIQSVPGKGFRYLDLAQPRPL